NTSRIRSISRAAAPSRISNRSEVDPAQLFVSAGDAYVDRVADHVTVRGAAERLSHAVEVKRPAGQRFDRDAPRHAALRELHEETKRLNAYDAAAARLADTRREEPRAEGSEPFGFRFRGAICLEIDVLRDRFELRFTGEAIAPPGEV